jgi:hypothetical protein
MLDGLTEQPDHMFNVAGKVDARPSRRDLTSRRPNVADR